MKTSKTLALTILAVAMTLVTTQAQNYKAPKIDASGKITDQNGKMIGRMTKEGVISDAMGMKIGQIALRFGCNDFGSLMIEENVVSAANTTHRTTTSEMERLIRDAGFIAARRRQDYTILPLGEPAHAA